MFVYRIKKIVAMKLHETLLSFYMKIHYIIGRYFLFFRLQKNMLLNVFIKLYFPFFSHT